jgi:tetratricopeptide (TPR) repeat protein
MPPLDASDVPHTTQTDHRIRRRPREDQDSSPDKPREPAIFDLAEARLTEPEVNRATGIYLARQAELQQDRTLAERAAALLESVVDLAPDDVAGLDALAVALTLQSRPHDAVDLWKRILDVAPSDEGALLSLAYYYARLEERTLALKYFDRLVSVNPWQSHVHGERAYLLESSNRLPAAIEAARKAVELDPSRADAYRWLAQAYSRLGDRAQSARYRELYRRMQPR